MCDEDIRTTAVKDGDGNLKHADENICRRFNRRKSMKRKADDYVATLVVGGEREEPPELTKSDLEV